MTEKTILIVDDDPDIRDVIRMRLERSSYRVIEAGDGKEALQLIHSYLPDVVLLDWQIPGVQGDQLLKTLKTDKTFDSIKVIIITGEDEAAKDALQHGAFASLVKPFGPLELLTKLREALA
jgi:two-component system, OmpR family, phosphate regulon response regulator PhoB